MSAPATSQVLQKIVQQVQHWDSFLSHLSSDDQTALDGLQQFASSQSASASMHASQSYIDQQLISEIDDALATKDEMEQFYTKNCRSAGESAAQTAHAGPLQPLRQYESLCQKVMNSMNSAGSILEKLQEQYQSTLSKTAALQQDCERLVQERDQLAKLSEGITSRINYFVYDPQDESDIYDLLIEKEINPNEADVIAHLMRKLEDSIRFLSAHMNFKESKAYLARFRLLQTRALANMRDLVVKEMTSCGSEIEEKHQKANLPVATEAQPTQDETAAAGEKPVSPSVTDSGSTHGEEDDSVDTEHAELSMFYIDFRTKLDPLRPIIGQIELRAMAAEHQPLLLDCFQAYYHQRYRFLYPIIKKKIQKLVDSNDIVKLIRNGCGYLIELCAQEHDLFQQFFNGELLALAFRQMMDGFFELIYNAQRTMLNQISELDMLCNLVEVLRVDVLHHGVKPRGAAAASFEPIVHRMIQDVQERVIFRASTVINDKIRNFKPAQTDLNYPEVLRTAQAGSQWFPTLDITLQLLNKLYKSLEFGVFEALSQEAIQLCVNQFIESSKKISERHSILDGELFLIKHLLMLKKQLLPFKAPRRISQSTHGSSSPTHSVISAGATSVAASTLSVSFSAISAPYGGSLFDFSHIQEGISKFLKGQSSFRVQDFIFDLLANTGKPKITLPSAGKEGKTDLDAQLKRVCESFIVNVTRFAMEPMMNFLQKLSSEQKLRQGEQKPASIPLQDALQVFESTQKRVESTMQTLYDKLSLYLSNPRTRVDLFRSIRASMVEVYEQYMSYIDTHLAEEQLRQALARVWSVAAFISYLRDPDVGETEEQICYQAKGLAALYSKLSAAMLATFDNKNSGIVLAAPKEDRKLLESRHRHQKLWHPLALTNPHLS